jgi:hypothetical protein
MELMRVPISPLYNIIADWLSGVKYSLKAAALWNPDSKRQIMKRQIMTNQVPVRGFQGSTFKGSGVG